MISILPRFLSDQDIQRIIALSGASHHPDEDGHVGRGKKPHHQPWLADVIWRAVDNLPIPGLAGCDPNVQVYRLGVQAFVPLHTDDDYTQDGLVARYSVLLRLNSEYVGGETRFRSKSIYLPPVGGGLVFRHDIPHEGLPLSSGEKLVVKTDLFVHQ